MSNLHYGAVLAAGLGTRLRPLTDVKPKPLVPMFGRPLIDWGLLALAKAKINSIGINCYHLGEQIEKEVCFQNILDELQIHEVAKQKVIIESELLGTGGGIRGIWKSLEISDPKASLLCLNGDALFDFSLVPLLKAHEDKKAIGTLALRKVPPNDPFGRIGVDAQGRVVRIAEVSGPLSHTEVAVGAFTGAQVVSKEVIDNIPEGFCDIFRTAHRVLLEQKKEIHAHFVESDTLWVDVGNHERYLDAHQALIDRPHSPLWQHVPTHQIKQGAILFEDAELKPSSSHLFYDFKNLWLGKGAKLSEVKQVSDTILWPNVHFAADDQNLSKQVICQSNHEV